MLEDVLFTSPIVFSADHVIVALNILFQYSLYLSDYLLFIQTNERVATLNETIKNFDEKIAEYKTQLQGAGFPVETFAIKGRQIKLIQEKKWYVSSYNMNKTFCCKDTCQA